MVLHRPIWDEDTIVEAGDVHSDDAPLVERRKTNVGSVRAVIVEQLKEWSVAWDLGVSWVH